MDAWIPLVCLLILASVLYPLLRKSRPQAKSGPPPPASVQVDGARLLCTCDEWRASRMRFRQGDPRRLCVHLCAHLGADILHIPESLMPFSQLITRMSEEGRDIPCAAPTFAFVLGDTGYVVTMYPQMRPWATIFVGRGEYIFNIQTGQWSDSGRPPFASDIGSLIQAEVQRRTNEAKKTKEPDQDTARTHDTDGKSPS